MNKDMERKYIAISIKHSNGCRFTLWGCERTQNTQKRCFSGYVGTMDYDKCEIYSLEDFRAHYGNGIIKCDAPVPLERNIVKVWQDHDTVLVDYEEYKSFLRYEYGIK